MSSAREQMRHFRRETIFKAAFHNALGNFLTVIGSTVIIESEITLLCKVFVGIIVSLSAIIGITGITYRDHYPESKKLLWEKTYYVLTFLSTLSLGCFLVHQGWQYGLLSTPHLGTWVFIVATFESCASFLYHKPKYFLLIYSSLHLPSSIWLFTVGAPVSYVLSLMTVAYAPMIYLRVIALNDLSVKTSNALQETKNKEEQLQKFLDLLPSQVAWLDSSLTCIGVNKSLQDNKGGQQILGENINNLEFEDNLIHEIRSFNDSNESQRKVELLLGKEDNERFYLCYLDKHNFGNGNEIFLIMLDIHDEKQLKEINEQSVKLAGLGQMASGLAHEINNPLAIAQGYMGVLKKNILSEKEESSEEYNELDKMFSTIAKTHDRISEVVRAMGAFRQKSGPRILEETPIKAIIEDGLIFFNQKFKGSDINLITNKIDPYLTYPCKKEEIEQVIISFVTNAIEILEKQPELKLKEIEVFTHIEGDMVYISVSDTGNALNKGEKELFTPFYTTKAPGKGFGVGLSISQYIANLYKGQIKAERKFGRTIFSLGLPIPNTIKNAS